MAFVQSLDRGAMLNADADCLVQGENRWSYRDVQTLSHRLGNKLHALGLGKGDKASVLSTNDARAFMCVFGFARAGLTWVPANPKLSPDDNRYMLDFFDCRVLVFHSDFADMIRQLRPGLPLLRHWICLDRSLSDAPSLDEWIADSPATRIDIPSDPDDLSLIMPTGGTTGRSKGVQITHRNMNTFLSAHMASLIYKQSERPVNLAAAPLTHAAGLLALPTLARGGKVIIGSGADPERIVEAIERHKVTEFFLPPTVIYRMLSHPGIEQRDFSSLRYFIYAAAPMAVEKLKQALKVFGPCMTQVFGQSEAPVMCAYLSPEEHFLNGEIASDEVLSSCGYPTALVEMRILDDCNNEVDNGLPGEICIRGDLVTPGYYKQPEVTEATIIDGWLHTGDIGYKDAAGRVHICDRKKDMIISGGFNIFPQEVEQLLWSHPAVEDCAVIGVPDSEWGEAVKAVVELKRGVSVDADELISLCKKEFGSLKSPKSVDFIDCLPRSPNGKVLKRELRDRYWKDQSRRV